MLQKTLKIAIQAVSLVFFILIAASSSSSSTTTATNYGMATSNNMGTVDTSTSNHSNYTFLGYANSEKEAKELAGKRGFTLYKYDSQTGIVLAL